MPLDVQHEHSSNKVLTPAAVYNLKQDSGCGLVNDATCAGDAGKERGNTTNGIELAVLNSHRELHVCADRPEHDDGSSALPHIPQTSSTGSASGSGGVYACRCKYGIGFAAGLASPVSTDSGSSTTSAPLSTSASGDSPAGSLASSPSLPLLSESTFEYFDKRRASEGNNDDIEDCGEDDCMSTHDRRHAPHTRSRTRRVLEFGPKLLNGSSIITWPYIAHMFTALKYATNRKRQIG